MNKRLLAATITIILAIATHAYLTNHYYPLKFGVVSQGETLCSVNEVLDCDVAATSSYSTVLGIPLSVWGLSFHIVLLIMVLFSWMGLTAQRERTLRVATLLAFSSLATSVVLAIISLTLLTAYCPFCFLAYVWSILIAIFLLFSLREPFGLVKGDLAALFTESRSLLVGIALIPVVAFLTHKSIVQSYGGNELEIVVKASVQEWTLNPPKTFEPSAALTKGPDDAKMTLVEFADFRCGHCAAAAPSIHAFLKSHPDVQFKFYNFPLDGECNDAIRSGDGVSCRLAKAVTCATGEPGWNLHYKIFEEQIKYQQAGTVENTDKLLEEAAKSVGIDWSQLQQCMEEPTTHEQVKAQAQAGVAANVHGTPSVFANGRLLSRGQLIPVLKAVYDKIHTND